MDSSKLFQLNINDFGKGLLVAVLVAVLQVILQSLQDCGIVCINWVNVGNIALTAGIAYLLKNLATNSKGELGKGE